MIVGQAGKVMEMGEQGRRMSWLGNYSEATRRAVTGLFDKFVTIVLILYLHIRL